MSGFTVYVGHILEGKPLSGLLLQILGWHLRVLDMSLFILIFIILIFFFIIFILTNLRPLMSLKLQPKVYLLIIYGQHVAYLGLSTSLRRFRP